MSRVHSRLPFSLLDRAITLAHATKVFLEADTGAVIGIREVLKARAVAANAARLAGKSIDAALYRTRSGNGWTYRVASAQKSVPARLLQAYIDLADTSAADDGPDVVLDYAPHVTTGDRPVGRYHWLAGHLGPQWDEQHIPLIIAGAGVRKGTVSRYPARLVDIAPTVERILGLSPAGSDGHVLADSLTRPARGDRAAQRAEEPALASTIAALKQRSGSH
jgi:arylsulfatase A-like enzyme